MQPDTTLPKDPRIAVYTAILTQLSTNNPTATVLQNTTGRTITWTRDTTGEYIGTLSEEIDTSKTTIYCNGGLITGWQFTIRFIDPGTIGLQSAISGVKNDGILLNTLVELKIH